MALVAFLVPLVVVVFWLVSAPDPVETPGRAETLDTRTKPPRAAERDTNEPAAERAEQLRDVPSPATTSPPEQLDPSPGLLALLDRRSRLIEALFYRERAELESDGLWGSDGFAPYRADIVAIVAGHDTFAARLEALAGLESTADDLQLLDTLLNEIEAGKLLDVALAALARHVAGFTDRLFCDRLIESIRKGRAGATPSARRLGALTDALLALSREYRASMSNRWPDSSSSDFERYSHALEVARIDGDIVVAAFDALHDRESVWRAFYTSEVLPSHFGMVSELLRGERYSDAVPTLRRFKRQLLLGQRAAVSLRAKYYSEHAQRAIRLTGPIVDETLARLAGTADVSFEELLTEYLELSDPDSAVQLRIAGLLRIQVASGRWSFPESVRVGLEVVGAMSHGRSSHQRQRHGGNVGSMVGQGLRERSSDERVALSRAEWDALIAQYSATTDPATRLYLVSIITQLAGARNPPWLHAELLKLYHRECPGPRFAEPNAHFANIWHSRFARALLRGTPLPGVDGEPLQGVAELSEAMARVRLQSGDDWAGFRGLFEMADRFYPTYARNASNPVALDRAYAKLCNVTITSQDLAGADESGWRHFANLAEKVGDVETVSALRNAATAWPEEARERAERLATAIEARLAEAAENPTDG